MTHLDCVFSRFDPHLADHELIGAEEAVEIRVFLPEQAQHQQLADVFVRRQQERDGAVGAHAGPARKRDFL